MNLTEFPRIGLGRASLSPVASLLFLLAGCSLADTYGDGSGYEGPRAMFVSG
jgi:hypothetical protein